jgi:5-methylcytosine-specific restriction protein A
LKSPSFIPGQIYKRSLIHDQFGGNRQGGIAPSAKGPYIFIFSGETGHQHGYKDQWENDDVFSYTGEGQVGDMEFAKGNLALLQHVKIGKRVYLFFSQRKAFVTYQGELEFIEADYFVAKDREGNDRQAIKFFFKRAGKHLPYQTEIVRTLIEGGRLSEFVPSETEKKGLVTSRVGQGLYRRRIQYRWKFACAVTGYSRNEILIASHIVPWKEASNQERLDVNNGILLSPTYDALFDRHLISFENSGQIILSDALSNSNLLDIGVTGKERVRDLSAQNHFYLEKHRLCLK